MTNHKVAKKWIAVYTKPRHEQTVEQELRKKGFDVYLPLLREKRKWSDRKKWVEIPLFRSYVFVKTELKNALFVLQTIGVVRAIKFAGKIAIVQDDQLNAIRVMIEGGFTPNPLDYFIAGDKVKVKPVH